jgi:hypothetical protein
MLALSVGLMALAFKPYLTARVTTIYFATLALFVFVDAHISNYGVRMIVPVIPMLLFLGIESPPPKLRLGSKAGAITEQWPEQL